MICLVKIFRMDTIHYITTSNSHNYILLFCYPEPPSMQIFSVSHYTCVSFTLIPQYHNLINVNVNVKDKLCVKHNSISIFVIPAS